LNGLRECDLMAMSTYGRNGEIVDSFELF
jgi:hypothetical protein